MYVCLRMSYVHVYVCVRMSCVHMYVYVCVCRVCIRTCVCVHCVCVDREVTNMLVDDTQPTIQQGGVGNCPGWKGDSKCLDGPQDSDDDEHQQSAFR